MQRAKLKACFSELDVWIESKLLIRISGFTYLEECCELTKRQAQIVLRLWHGTYGRRSTLDQRVNTAMKELSSGKSSEDADPDT